MSAPIGNKYAQEWTLENAQPRFEAALEFALNDVKCLCLQDAILYSGIPISTFYYLAGNHKVLEAMRKDMAAAIIARVNALALDTQSPSPASPSIWRMKQLGEIDSSVVNNNLSGSVKTDNTHKVIIEDYEDD